MLMDPDCELEVIVGFDHSSIYQGTHPLSQAFQRPYKPDGKTLRGLLLLFPQQPNFRYRFLNNTSAIQNLGMAEYLFD
jgi:hypothetical protein